MRIGLTSIFAFRPHVEHLFYLSRLAESDGHQVSFMTCDSSVGACYNKLLKGSDGIKPCAACILGGFRSYVPSRQIFSANRKYRAPLTKEKANSITESSAYSIARVEDPFAPMPPLVLQMQNDLHESVEIIYGSTLEWIRRERLDRVMFFNGRMDLTRAVMEACRDAGIHFVSVERPWLGHGIQLLPNDNCLTNIPIHKMVKEFRDLPLTSAQAGEAARLLCSRFYRKNHLEWRVYNPNAEEASWPTAGSPKVLFLPGSKSEFLGHPEYSTPFLLNSTGIVDGIVEKLGIPHRDLVVRSHPIWAETIGVHGGRPAYDYYSKWAKARGAYFIEPEAKADTYSLIRQADIVIGAGGSSGPEAAAMGKHAISISPTFYTGAGFTTDVLKPEDLDLVPKIFDRKKEDSVRHVLRFFYMLQNRYPQFVPFVRAKALTKYEYFEGANPFRLTELLKTGELVADDSSYAHRAEGETQVMDSLLAYDWKTWAERKPMEFHGHPLKVGRKPLFAWVDPVREMFPKGDR